MKTRRETFEEALNLYREFKTEKMKKSKSLCETRLSQSEEKLRTEFKDLLNMIESWLEYDKRRNNRSRL